MKRRDRLIPAVTAAAFMAVASLAQQTGHPGQGSFNGGSVPNPISTPTLKSSVRPYVDVTAPPYNAKCDGSDDTAAIAAAITAAQRSTTGCGTNSVPGTANCSGVVFFPNVFCYASHIQQAAYVKLLGTGPENSGLVQLAGSNQNFITGTSPTVDQRMVIQDLSINGNKANQTGTFDCVHWDGTGALSTVRSTRNKIYNTWAFNCGQDGISDFGDAGSDYITESKGFSNGRYGLNLDKYDSHAPGGEYYSNGVAGINLGTHGNGSANDNKVWGNGTTTTGTGMQVGSGNWRIDSLDAQDNFCWGATATGNHLNLTGLILDGNGQTGGGLGCGGLQLTAVNYSFITGTFQAHVDAGTSDYALGFVGSNNKNIIVMPISDASQPLVSTYSGTINNNNWLGNTVNGWLYNFNQEYLNGISLRGFSDSGATQTWALLGNIGQLNLQSMGIGGGQAMSKPPHMSFSGSSGTTFTGVNTNYGGSYTPTAAITLTGFDVHLDSAGTCTVYPVLAIWDETAAAVVAGSSLTLSATPTVNFHASFTANVPAGHTLAFATTTPGTCTTNPTSPHFNTEFEMQ